MKKYNIDVISLLIGVIFVLLLIIGIIGIIYF